MLACRSWQTGTVSDLRERLDRARLYLVCDDRADEFLVAVLRGGVDAVQLRVKQASDAQIISTGRRFSELCSAHGALFILNDRPDLVVETGADGVHLGQEDAAVTEARALIGPRPLIGLSTHSPAQVDRAAVAGVDYIGVGPVHETPTKPGRPAVGLELVRYASAHANMPWFAIGGIDPGNVHAVLAAGARRIAVVRALTAAADPELGARRLLAGIVGEPDRHGVRLGAT